MLSPSAEQSVISVVCGQTTANGSCCVHLQAVSLRDNNFYGNITQFALCALQTLDLSDNRFTGPLPVPLSTGPLGRPPWLRLMSIRLTNNELTGTLPEFAYGVVSFRSPDTLHLDRQSRQEYSWCLIWLVAAMLPALCVARTDWDAVGVGIRLGEARGQFG